MISGYLIRTLLYLYYLTCKVIDVVRHTWDLGLNPNRCLIDEKMPENPPLLPPPLPMSLAGLVSC